MDDKKVEENVRANESLSASQDHIFMIMVMN